MMDGTNMKIINNEYLNLFKTVFTPFNQMCMSLSEGKSDLI